MYLSLGLVISTVVANLALSPGHSFSNVAVEADGMLAAYIPTNTTLWMNYRNISVKFLNPQILDTWTVGRGEKMTTSDILFWANEWHRRGEGIIPSFVIAREGEESDIRVHLTNYGGSRSFVGMRATSASRDQPTMYLQLNANDDQENRGIVIHEFGHALGLGHEHQRSDFWESIKKYIDVQKMKDDYHIKSDAFFKRNWGIDNNAELGCYSIEYDPESVMHYPFKIEWLTDGYDNETKVRIDGKNKILNAKETSALLGVHKRHNSVTHEPSVLDIELLKVAYGENEHYDLTDSVFNERPTFIELNHLELAGTTFSVVEMIGQSYYEVGTRLLEDSYGNIMMVLIHDARSVHDISITILMRWLQGGGMRQVTWKTLIHVLEKSSLVALAQKVREALLYKKYGFVRHVTCRNVFFDYHSLV